jgi:hypothetical protein
MFSSTCIHSARRSFLTGSFTSSCMRNRTALAQNWRTHLVFMVPLRNCSASPITFVVQVLCIKYLCSGTHVKPFPLSIRSLNFSWALLLFCASSCCAPDTLRAAAPVHGNPLASISEELAGSMYGNLISPTSYATCNGSFIPTNSLWMKESGTWMLNWK